jgi:hypothetical protein
VIQDRQVVQGFWMRGIQGQNIAQGLLGRLQVAFLLQEYMGQDQARAHGLRVLMDHGVN